MPETYSPEIHEFYEECGDYDSQELRTKENIVHAPDHLRRINFITSVIKSMKWNSLLDIGCGGCFFERELQKDSSYKEKEIYGLDLTKGWSSLSKDYLQTIRGDWVYLPFKEKSVDLIVWSEGPEHAINPVEVFEKISKLTKKYFITSVPNWERLIPGHLTVYDEELLKGQLFPFFTKVSIIKVKPWWIMALCII